MSLLSFRIVIVLCLMVTYWHKSAPNRVERSKVEIALKKRDIGSSSTDVEEWLQWIRESPEAAGHSHDDSEDNCSPAASSNCDTGSSAEDISDHNGPSDTVDSAKNELPCPRKAFIQEKLATHHETIMEMRTGWQKLHKLIVFLEGHKVWLRTWGQVASGKTIEGILEDVRTYHKYILQLVQDCLRGWGGLGGIVIGAKDRGKDVEQIQKDMGSRPTKKPRFKRKKDVGKGLDASGTSRSPHSTQIIGHSSLYMVLRRNIKAQKKASMKVSQKQHEPYLTQDSEGIPLQHLDLISEKLKADSVLKLNMLLQSIIFPPPDPEIDDDGREARRAIKACFQTFVFQGLQYMYNFGMISKDHIQQFFQEENTQKILGIHLTDLFNTYWYSFFDHDVFFPDMSFIMSHWHTEHLHTSLQALLENQKAIVIYTALKETVKAYYDMEEWLHINLERSHNFFIGENFAPELITWQKNKANCGSSSPSVQIDSSLREGFQRMIDFFQSPAPDPTLYDEEINLIMKRIDYLLAYHILNFMKVYFPEILSEFFKAPSNDNTFQTQMMLFQVGLEIQQHLNLEINFANSSPPAYLKLETTPNNVKEFEQGLMQEDLNALSDTYMNLWNEASFLSEGDSKVKNWLKGQTVSENIIDFMTRKSQGLKPLSLTYPRITHEYRNLFMVFREPVRPLMQQVQRQE